MLNSRLTLLKVLWRVVRTIYARLPRQRGTAEVTIQELRESYRSLAFFLNAGAPPLPHIEERIVAVPSGRQRVRLYDPGIAEPAPTVILIHGGGWVAGDIDTYDGFARQIAKRSGLRCLSIEYALAPEQPFPAPLEDCIALVRWAASEASASLGIDPARIALVGDSAGANLALAVCLALRNAGASPIRGAALAYGCYSFDLDTPSVRAYGGGGYLLSAAEMARYRDDYLPNRTDRENPLAVPILADLRSLPPLYIAVGEFDPLRDDSERLAERARMAGVDIEFRLWPGTVHGAISLMGWIDAMEAEVDRIGSFLEKVTRVTWSESRFH